MGILNFASRRKFEQVFGPPDADELLPQVISLASEPPSPLPKPVSDLLSLYPMSHHLRLMAAAALKANGFSDDALRLIGESLILYPDSPMLLGRYLALKRDVPEPVASTLRARAESARESVR